MCGHVILSLSLSIYIYRERDICTWLWCCCFRIIRLNNVSLYFNVSFKSYRIHVNLKRWIHFHVLLSNFIGPRPSRSRPHPKVAPSKCVQGSVPRVAVQVYSRVHGPQMHLKSTFSGRTRPGQNGPGQARTDQAGTDQIGELTLHRKILKGIISKTR